MSMSMIGRYHEDSTSLIGPLPMFTHALATVTIDGSFPKVLETVILHYASDFDI